MKILQDFTRGCIDEKKTYKKEMCAFFSIQLHLNKNSASFTKHSTKTVASMTADQ